VFVAVRWITSLARMPSQLHESHLFLFRNQPTLAADLICSALGVKLPSYNEARIASADLTEVQPAEYRADMVVELWQGDVPVYGIVVEVQLAEDSRKRFAWPAYVANLRARLKCPVSLLVVTTDEAVARWAARCVPLGGLNHFVPYVLQPSGVPRVTSKKRAQTNPELAVLSAMAHGRDVNVTRAVKIAKAAESACRRLDVDRSRMYLDLILISLGEAARQALGQMDARTYQFQSDFARKYIALGKSEGVAEGEARGRAALIIRQLTRRFGQLDPAIETRIRRTSIVELESMGERLLAAGTLEEVLGA
jgi:hypothetical protein